MTDVPDPLIKLGTIYDHAEPPEEPEELVSIYHGLYLHMRVLGDRGPTNLMLTPREAVALADLLYRVVEEHY